MVPAFSLFHHQIVKVLNSSFYVSLVFAYFLLLPERTLLWLTSISIQFKKKRKEKHYCECTMNAKQTIIAKSFINDVKTEICTSSLIFHAIVRFVFLFIENTYRTGKQKIKISNNRYNRYLITRPIYKMFTSFLLIIFIVIGQYFLFP